MTNTSTNYGIHKLTGVVALILAAISPSMLAAPSTSSVPPAAPSTVAISIVDDPSGGAARGALDPSTASQLNGLLDLAGTARLTLRYWLVQEAVAEPVAATFEAWRPPHAFPEPPPKTLPYQQYLKASQAYLEEIRRFKASRDEWEKATVQAFETFLQNATEARLALEARWMEQLKRNGGRDFPRSAISATLSAVAQADATAQYQFVIASTDGRDLPGGGKAGRKTPLTAKEVSESVKMIFISADGKPPTAPLLSSIAGRPHTRIARDLQEAAAFVTSAMQEERGEKVAAAAR